MASDPLPRLHARADVTSLHIRLQWKAPNAVIGGVFTGTFFGVYAHGARLPILIPAVSPLYITVS